jgi:hypothetical protein
VHQYILDRGRKHNYHYGMFLSMAEFLAAELPMKPALVVGPYYLPKDGILSRSQIVIQMLQT